MTRPRSRLIALDQTPYYHCLARCVRRAFLCGRDRFTGRSFDHRKPWLVARLAQLASIFAIDVAAYAVMSNHFHVVLHVNRQRALSWTDEQVLERWTRLYKGPALIQRYREGEPLSEAELRQVAKLIGQFREKLYSISRFMACLNEYITRKANREDGCTGRFWEGRFKSQALLDEAALLSCMAYIDLNPVRAGIASDPEGSDFTSVQQRIARVRRGKAKVRSAPDTFRKPELMAFADRVSRREDTSFLPFSLKAYLELVDWTGRIVRNDKKGLIQAQTPGLLQTLGLSEGQWRILTLEIQKESVTMLDGLTRLASHEKRAAKSLAA